MIFILSKAKTFQLNNSITFSCFDSFHLLWISNSPIVAIIFIQLAMIFSKTGIKFFLAFLVRRSLSQFTFLVQFPDIRDQKDQPHVDCQGFEYLPKTGFNANTGNRLGSCRSCTEDYYCINEFIIKTVTFDAFTGQNTDVTTCRPVDFSGNTVSLDSKNFLLSLRTKAPSYAAPQGWTISNLGENLKVELSIYRGYVQTKYLPRIFPSFLHSATKARG